MDELLQQLAANRALERSPFNGKAGDTSQENVVTLETTAEIAGIKAEHLTQISFFQHERLVHLIVTVLFAILEMFAIALAMFFPGIGTLLLVVVVLVLLIPYIRHYYILENEVQKMYGQYDKLCELEFYSVATESVMTE